MYNGSVNPRLITPRTEGGLTRIIHYSSRWCVHHDDTICMRCNRMQKGGDIPRHFPHFQQDGYVASPTPQSGGDTPRQLDIHKNLRFFFNDVRARQIRLDNVGTRFPNHS